VNLLQLHSNQLNLNEFTAVNNLVAMVTVEHNPNPQFSKAHITTLNFNNFKIIELWD
jgi:hypothetical protein